MSYSLQRIVAGRWLMVCLAVVPTVPFSTASEAPPSEDWVSSWTAPEFSEKSPYWWTVSDQVSYGELKATLTDPGANEARYREAVGAGLERGSPPDSNTRFVVYVHGGLTPQLMPLWYAYQWLCIRVRPGPYFWDPNRPYREMRDSLRAAGLSIDGAEAVLAQCDDAKRKFEMLNREAEPLRQRFHRVRRRAEWLLGKSGTLRALYLGDDALIARASFTDAEEVSRLRAVWDTSYRDQVGLQAIEKLKARLAAEDWELLKKYLLDEVVPGLQYVEVEERVPEAQPYTVLIRLLMAFGFLVGAPVVLVYLRIRRRRSANC